MVSFDNEPKKSKYKYLKSFIAGGLAGVISKSIIAPIERVKYMYIVILLLYQTRSKIFTYSRFFRDFNYIVKTHGAINLWRGNSMNIIKIFPHAAIVMDSLN